MQFWTILPGKFREWWMHCYARGLPDMNNILLDYPVVVVRDSTAIIEE
jgi:hypothetical protein